ncbi:MAG: hypothetical protein WBC44_04490 [Planctomycetaceae bacterium]
MTKHRLIPIAAGFFIALAVLLPVQAAAATLSMREFLALKPEWDALAESGKSLRIEGRIASASRRLVRLQNCPLDFRPIEKTLPELVRTAVAVEITGRLDHRNTELVFVVSEMIEPASDGEVFALRESALDVTDPADWYELADWADGRGTFYEDRSLLDKAAGARRRGLSLERETVAGDAEALARLAKKSGGFGLEETQHQLAHESLHARWDGLRKNMKADLKPLTEAIAAQLPGASKPLPEWPAELAASYAKNPIAVYDRTAATEQATLERIFFTDVQQAAIERLAEPAGANGEQIADRLAAALPERPELARVHREREIAFRLKHIATATRAEAMLLARRLNERDRPDAANQALVAWLAAREAAARKEQSLAELVRVAEDYAQLLNDNETAARLLAELLKDAPESTEIPEKLRQLGYVNDDGEWITKAEAATRPVDPVKLAMREGRVAVNMSPEQVRKTLGTPDQIARAASTAQVHEVWIYGETGRGGLAVHFLRYAARSSTDSRVVGVATLAR